MGQDKILLYENECYWEVNLKIEDSKELRKTSSDGTNKLVSKNHNAFGWYKIFVFFSC